MILRSELVLSRIGIPHAFTLRDPTRPSHGNISFKFGDSKDVLANRAHALEAMDQDPNDLVLASQAHGTLIHRIHETDRGRGALDDESKLSDADGLVTDVPGLPVAVQVTETS